MSECCSSTTSKRSQNDSVSEWRTLSLKPGGKAGRGDCCVAPYVADNSYDQIMLRFRPIAPKPAPSAAAGGSSSGGSSPDSKKGSRASHARGGRSNITSSEKKKKNRNIARCLSSRTPEEEMDRVTLPLLPPRPQDDHKGNYCSRVVGSDVSDDTKEGKPKFMQSGDGNYDLDPEFGFPMTKLACKGSLVRGGDGGAFVVVDAWVEGDEGRVMNLRDDACPCFISDGEGRVRWLNEAFRRMVATTGGDEGGLAEGRELEEVGWDGTGRSFACRVRMVCTWLGMKMGSMTSPCDVWRLDGGDFAWRLDVGAALRLAP